MKRATLRKFDELNELVKSELKEISNEIIEEHETYEEAIKTITDYFESEFKLDDYVYSEIYQIAIKEATTKT